MIDLNIHIGYRWRGAGIVGLLLLLLPVFASCHADKFTGAGAESLSAELLPTEGDPFFNWLEMESKTLSPGVKYTRYSFTTVAQTIHVVDVDLTNKDIAIETSMANDVVPNPNGNENKNNGPNGRETLRQNIERKRKEGWNVVAGINTGFFDSHNGIPRGVHVENGEIVYMNHPEVRKRLGNHVWGIGVTTDGRICFDSRQVRGRVRVGDKSYEYFSVNDTTLGQTGVNRPYNVNLYTHRFRLQSPAGCSNPITRDAVYAVCRSENPIRVNVGWQKGVVTRVVDCRKGEEPPIVTHPGEWVMQFAGTIATTGAERVKVGMELQVECELVLGGKVLPLAVYNAGMYHYLRDGKYVAPPTPSVADKIYQTMNVGTNQSGTRLCLFAVDGGTVSRGLDFREAAEVAKKLGLWDVVRFDGGGSTSMWVLDGSQGRMVNNISDPLGERSCMNYLHIVAK